MREKVERGGEGFHSRKPESSYHHRMNQISTSFFITNFPPELGWGDIWKIFVKFGSVSDVYIPKKVDKWGRKFGFVKFKDVRNGDDLCKKLQDVWYGTTKLSVKRARFGKEDLREEATVTKTVLPRRRAALDVKVIEGVSFKSLLSKGKGDLCVGTKEDGGVRRKSRLHSVEDLAPLQIEVCDSTLKELEGSKVGFLNNSVDFSSFQERLMLDGLHEVKVTRMGGNMVLLQSPCEGELEEVLRCNKLWWERCFSKIIPWKPNLLSESRETWIQIFGIPLHAWDECCFKSVVGKFGVFLDFDEATISKHRFDLARVKLRTVRRELIDTVVQLSVRGGIFDVWVVEERCCCGEEGRVEEEGSDDNSGRSSMNSGAEVWQGQKEDLFSDGSADSDKSEYQVEVALL
ncbi:hypothetical protein P8452_77662 [Trifolium repens]|nr:hypothetical protein P8452_77662 [Trifolium repens]